MTVKNTPDFVRYNHDIGTRSIILDRDGTLNLDRGYTFRISELSILPKVSEVLALATSNKINLYIASNQGGVALERYSLTQMRNFNYELVNQFATVGVQIQAAACCLHHPNSINLLSRDCDCRKPLPGLLSALIGNRTLTDYNWVMIGDSLNDKLAASSINMKFISVSEEIGWDAVKSWISVDDSH